MTTLTFKDPDEARAWDAIVTALVAWLVEQPDDVVARADAMILERRKRMAEKVKREWIPHKPGDPMPCDGDDYVMVMFRNHAIPPARMQAIDYSWEETGGAHTITAWRPA
jgi:hypothetical protein